MRVVPQFTAALNDCDSVLVMSEAPAAVAAGDNVRIVGNLAASLGTEDDNDCVVADLSAGYQSGIYFIVLELIRTLPLLPNYVALYLG